MEVIIHPGRTKTGTSWLQNCYLKPHPDLYYIGMEAGSKPGQNEWRNLKKYIINKSTASFDQNRAKQKVRGLLSSIPSEENKIIISSEDLTDPPNRALTFYSIKRLRNAIKNEVEKIRCIFYIRSQNSLIASHYAQYIRNGGRQSLLNYLTAPQNNNRFSYERFHHYNLVNKLYDWFGAENVIIELQERMRQAEDIVLKRISNFINIKTIPAEQNKKEYNPRLTKPMLNIMHQLNNLLNTSSSEQWKALPFGWAIRLAAKILYYTDYENNELTEYMPTNYEKGMIPYYDAAINDKIHNSIRSIIDSINHSLIKTVKKYEVPTELKESVVEDYAETNKKLNKIIAANIRHYNYIIEDE